ncbi:fungal hydrophobin [Aspergillus tetrazonus]
MKFAAALAVVFLFGTTHAIPNPPAQAQELEQQRVRFLVPDNVTVKQGSSKCGDQAQLSCCNKAEYAGDTTKVTSGPLSGLLGSGSGAEGLGLFSQCSKLDVALLLAEDILNQQCKQNIVCCANDEHSADNDLIGVSLPCIALGSLL